jgi:mono/diheme cytochrome c family protein
MNLNQGARIAVAVLLVLALAAGIYFLRRAPSDQTAQAPAAPEQTAKAPAPQTPETVIRDPYQRSLAILEFKKAADKGPDRGREIFYYKCWFCHNEFAGPQSAPDLANVFKREKLLSGRPSTADGIKDEIRNGGAGMAAYKYVLNEADLDDLVAYIREGCCWNSKSPPPNPRYRGDGAVD